MSAKLIRTIHHIKPEQRGGILTMGNFDGVHLGHQQLLIKAVKIAHIEQVHAQVLTFEPQPQEYFSGSHLTIPRLTKLREKFLQLSTHGVHDVFIIKFNQQLAELTASDFLSMLKKNLAPNHIVIGEDFRFGRGREGDLNFLKANAERYGFCVDAIPAFMINHKRVSSTEIRESLKRGDLNTAKQLLGRPYTMMGKVSHGRKLGRELGCPTANIHVNRRLTPVHGIYTVMVHGIGLLPWRGVASVGTRPTIDGTVTLLEVHLLDFEGDLYGRQVEVEFCSKLRDEIRYDNLDLLTQQIAIDVQQAKEYFKCSLKSE
jgi:riboflavin kinase/FMN adenylyltransferase